MNKSTLSITQHGAVKQILLDRPEALNALNGQMTDDLTDAFLEAEQDDQVKVVLLSGAGRAFWAGADLMEMGSGRAETRHTFQDLMMSLIEYSKPLLIAVNGVGVGIGATICGMADAVFMSDQARLRCPFSSLGLTAEACSTVTFSALMGHQRASWFLMSSEWMDANACVEAGLALEVVAHDDLVARAMERAQQLAALPLSSLQTTKGLMKAPLKEALIEAMQRENKGLAALTGSPANREALSAFKEKRTPNFDGL